MEMCRCWEKTEGETSYWVSSNSKEEGSENLSGGWVVGVALSQELARCCLKSAHRRKTKLTQSFTLLLFLAHFHRIRAVSLTGSHWLYIYKRLPKVRQWELCIAGQACLISNTVNIGKMYIFFLRRWLKKYTRRKRTHRTDNLEMQAPCMLYSHAK